MGPRWSAIGAAAGECWFAGAKAGSAAGSPKKRFITGARYFDRCVVGLSALGWQGPVGAHGWRNSGRQPFG